MMSLDKLKPEVQQALTLAVPAAALLFAAVLVVPKTLARTRSII